MTELICDVCRAEPAVGVASSVLGAFSQAYGVECIRQGAESLGMLYATLDCIGGPANAAPWARALRSYKDGRYIDWDEIVASYVPKPLPGAEA